MELIYNVFQKKILHIWMQHVKHIMIVERDKNVRDLLMERNIVSIERP